MVTHSSIYKRQVELPPWRVVRQAFLSTALRTFSLSLSLSRFAENRLVLIRASIYLSLFLSLPLGEKTKKAYTGRGGPEAEAVGAGCSTARGAGGGEGGYPGRSHRPQREGEKGAAAAKRATGDEKGGGEGSCCRRSEEVLNIN